MEFEVEGRDRSIKNIIAVEDDYSRFDSSMHLKERERQREREREREGGGGGHHPPAVVHVVSSRGRTGRKTGTESVGEIAGGDVRLLLLGFIGNTSLAGLTSKSLSGPLDPGWTSRLAVEEGELADSAPFFLSTFGAVTRRKLSSSVCVRMIAAWMESTRSWFLNPSKRSQ